MNLFHMRFCACDPKFAGFKERHGYLYEKISFSYFSHRYNIYAYAIVSICGGSHSNKNSTKGVFKC